MTVALGRSEKTGVDLANVSVVLVGGSLLRIWGELLPLPEHQTSGKYHEPGITASFLNEGGKILYVKNGTLLFPFKVNNYSIFLIEVNADSEHLSISDMKEIRLSPFFFECD